MRLDAFVGKLDDIGVPRQSGIYVSTMGYTSGAIERAEDAGIRALTLHGLSVDRLTSEIIEVILSTVFLLAEIGSVGKLVEKEKGVIIRRS